MVVVDLPNYFPNHLKGWSTFQVDTLSNSVPVQLPFQSAFLSAKSSAGLFGYPY